MQEHEFAESLYEERRSEVRRYAEEEDIEFVEGAVVTGTAWQLRLVAARWRIRQVREQAGMLRRRVVESINEPGEQNWRR